MIEPKKVNVPSGFGSFFGEEAKGARVSDGRPSRVRAPVRIDLPKRRSDVDALLPLINIVFLLLIFLMSVGTLGGALPPGLSVARTQGAGEPATTADALVVLPDGSLRIGQRPVERAALADALAARDEAAPKRLTVVADRAMPAETLLGVMRDLAGEGIATVSLVTSDDRAD